MSISLFNKIFICNLNFFLDFWNNIRFSPIDLNVNFNGGWIIKNNYLIFFSVYRFSVWFTENKSFMGHIAHFRNSSHQNAHLLKDIMIKLIKRKKTLSHFTKMKMWKFFRQTDGRRCFQLRWAKTIALFAFQIGIIKSTVTS